MSNPGIPRGGEPPQEIIDLIEQDLKAKGHKPKSIGPMQPDETVRGNHEQQYQAEIIMTDSNDGIAVYDANKQNGEWKVTHLRTQQI